MFYLSRWLYSFFYIMLFNIARLHCFICNNLLCLSIKLRNIIQAILLWNDLMFFFCVFSQADFTVCFKITLITLKRTLREFIVNRRHILFFNELLLPCSISVDCWWWLLFGFPCPEFGFILIQVVEIKRESIWKLDLKLKMFLVGFHLPGEVQALS